MSLFDKLQASLEESSTNADTPADTTEIIAPLSGEIIHIEDVPDPIFAEKIVVMELLLAHQGIKWLPL
jgi:hypothetical protein